VRSVPRVFIIPGRRKMDYDSRTTVTKKILVTTVATIDLVYLVASHLLHINYCG
jgi:hypothetical protein